MACHIGIKVATKPHPQPLSIAKSGDREGEQNDL
jgi:hypothetical protein